MEKGIHDDAAKLKEKGKTRLEIPNLITKDQEAPQEIQHYKPRKERVDDSMFDDKI